ATAIARAATSDAVADAVEAAEFFDVEMDDFAGPLALVARGGFLRLQGGAPVEAAAFENARDTGFGDTELGCDVLLGAAFTSQTFHGIARGWLDLVWQIGRTSC